MRKKRNKFIYDIYDVEIPPSELKYLFKEVEKFIHIVEKIIRQKILNKHWYSHMKNHPLIKKIEQAGLLGRGCGTFPTAKKMAGCLK